MKPRALSTLIVPNKFCMPATGSAPERDRVLAGLAVDVERVVAGGEDVDRVVARAGVEASSGRRPIVLFTMNVLPPLPRIDRQRRDRSRGIVASWWRFRCTRDAARRTPSSLSSVQVWPVVSFSSWKVSA